MAKTEIAGWGNWQRTKAECRTVASIPEAQSVNQKSKSYISRGSGRSYGDSANFSEVLLTEQLSDMIEFNESRGTYVCETGKLLLDVLNDIVPRGYFLPVTPGTKFVSVGGAIAADVHGKNHHKHGCFSEYVNWFRLLLADGRILTCSKTENTELFWATCGGMGLTGVILEASFNLIPIETDKILNRTIKCFDLDETIKCLLDNGDSSYSVAWVDTANSGQKLGRSLVMLGEHATKADVAESRLGKFRFVRPKLNIPFELPNWLSNPVTAKTFNTIYFNAGSKKDSVTVVDIDSYFYPLDKIDNWNRIYGIAGFTQYQVVIPMEHAFEGMHELFRMLSNSKERSFLTVMKIFGEENEGWLSFPKRGLTVTLDFKRTDESLQLMDELDELVQRYGGRSYLAKDARMNRSFFESGYPRLNDFKNLVSNIDPNRKYRSVQSERLGIK